MILSILNQKGGAGKSMTSLSLAAIWAAQGHRVLLVDADPQATITNYFEPAEHTLFDVLSDSAPLKDAALEVRPNLWLLASDERLGEAARLWDRLPGVLGAWKSIVIIDAPAGWSTPQRAIVKASTDYLIPVNSEMGALESGLSTQSFATPVNRKARLAGYLLTCWRDTSGARDIADYNVPWLGVRIPRDERVNTLVARQQTIMEGHAGGVRPAYLELAEELLKRWPEQRKK